MVQLGSRNILAGRTCRAVPCFLVLCEILTASIFMTLMSPLITNFQLLEEALQGECKVYYTCWDLSVSKGLCWFCELDYLLIFTVQCAHV